MTALKTSLKASLIATAIATLPFGAHAAGLGALNVYSGLGQPLRAEVELKATLQELESLTARIASSDAFRQANLPYSSVMTALRLAVERRGNGAVVRISSDRPLNEPFVDLLLELDWAAGRLIREYTFLLDPVPLNAPAPVAAQVSTPTVSPASSGRTRAAAPAPASMPAPSAPGSYEVRRGDTLRGVAEAHRPESASLDQMLIALFRDNPEAFDGGNMNRLRAGAILNIPAEPAILSLEPGQARREVTAQSADFEAYRRRLAGTAASRPASAEAPPSRAAAGAIVPRVEEGVGSDGSGDRVKVSAATDPAASPPAGDSARLARLQALEEELVARDKGLEEANARLAALEASIREMQQLLELRNEGLAQLQRQAKEAGAGAASAPATPPETTAPDAGRADQRAGANSQPSPRPDAGGAAAKPVAEPAPPEQPGFVEELLRDPKMLAGGGGILALLLGYVGLKARERRTAANAGADRHDVTDDLPAVTNSVFGATGGQNVNTGDTSVIHTDFSQSGLSAIDADEGVDPVAEADVYMAYGRDAQAEEILLDALKTDSSRPAIFLKLLEIYEQRKNLKQFDAIASDLYARTGGEGGDWQKAAEMGRRIDPANPLYGSSATTLRSAPTEMGAPRSEPAPRGAASETAAGLAAAAATSQTESPSEAEASDAALDDVRPDLDFTTYSAAAADASLSAPRQGEFDPLSGGSSAVQIDSLDLSLPDATETGPLEAEIASASEPVIEALPEIDSAALDFDLDAGLGLDVPLPALGGTSGPSAELDVPVPQVAPGDGLDLEIGAEHLSAPAADEFLSATVVADGAELALPDQSIEFDLNAEDDRSRSEGMLADFDLDAAAAADKRPSEEGDTVAADLEKTTFDSSLLDFDFNLEDADQADAGTAPAFDLSSIDLDLDLEPGGAAAGGQAESLIDASDISTEIPRAAIEELNEEALQEVDTKLELARAYDEMGDKDGARELIEEVLREGSPDQQAAGRRLLEQLG